MDELEERIRARAYQMWENEGRPDGQAETHWEKARILVAIEDDRTSLKPVEEPKPEEARIMENLGEFPGALTDQGDEEPFPKAASPPDRPGGRRAVSQGSQSRTEDSASMIKSERSLQGAGEHPAASTASVGKPWSDVDDAVLRRGLRRAMAPAEIAGVLGRTTEEVFQRLATLADAYQHEGAKDAARMWRPRRSPRAK